MTVAIPLVATVPEVVSRRDQVPTPIGESRGWVYGSHLELGLDVSSE